MGVPHFSLLSSLYLLLPFWVRRISLSAPGLCVIQGWSFSMTVTRIQWVALDPRVLQPRQVPAYYQHRLVKHNSPHLSDPSKAFADPGKSLQVTLTRLPSPPALSYHTHRLSPSTRMKQSPVLGVKAWLRLSPSLNSIRKPIPRPGLSQLSSFQQPTLNRRYFDTASIRSPQNTMDIPLLQLRDGNQIPLVSS